MVLASIASREFGRPAMSPGTPSPSGQMRTAPGPSTVGVLKIALPFESQQKGTSSGVLPFWSSFPPIYYPSSYRITAQSVESSIVGQIGIRRIDATDEKQSADEWTRTARLPITGDKQGVAGTVGVCRSPIPKPVSFICLAPCCTVFRSRWCQRGVSVAPPRREALAFLTRPDGASTRHRWSPLRFGHSGPIPNRVPR